MSSAKGKILRLLSRVALKRAIVASAADIGGFRHLVMTADTPTFAAGTKVQVLLPSDDTRTYTPIPTPNGFALLGWRHAGGPGADWLARAAVGDEVLFVGPQRAIELPAGPVILVGDETSVAVAAALEVERPGQVHAIIQADAPDHVMAAAATYGLTSVTVVARADTDATVAMVVANLAERPNAVVGLTGRSVLVTDVRAGLRYSGGPTIRMKPHWILGRAGLD